MTVRVNVNEAEIARIFYSPAGPVFEYVQDKTERVRNAAVRKAPRDTGALAASIEATVNLYGTRIVGRVGTRLQYGLYQHEGTGIYGPKRAPIRPVSAKALRFKPGRSIGPSRRGARGSSPEARGGWVFAKYVRGTPPNPFLVDALEEVMPGLVRKRGTRT